MSFKGKFKNFFTLEDEYEEVEEVNYTEDEMVPNKNKHNKNVVSLSAIQQSTAKVVLYEPKSYDEVQEIADNLLSNRAIIINLQRLDNIQAKRVIDFLSGTVYAVKGDIQKLGLETFLCTPETMDVTGAISSSLFEEQDLEKGW